MNRETPIVYDAFTIDCLSQYSTMGQYVSVADYLRNPIGTIAKIPSSPGIYFVVLAYDSKPLYKFPGTGGYFKGKDPNVAQEDLDSKWVQNANILYIGKAGGMNSNGTISNNTLQKRIKSLLKFGNGHPAGHWGGRYMWQLEPFQEFKIYWYDMSNDIENVLQLKKTLLKEFDANYGNLPFANLE